MLACFIFEYWLGVNHFGNLETKGVCEQENPILHNFQDPIYLNDEGRSATLLPIKESREILQDHHFFCEKRLLKLHYNLNHDTILLKK